MNLISKNGGLVSFSAIADEIRPPSGFHLPDLIDSIARRYSATKPTPEKLATEGAKFRDAQWRHGYTVIRILELGLYSDGISVTTTDTADSEVVLKDFFEWLMAEHHFREPITPPIWSFQSDLVFKFDNDPLKAFGLPIVQFLGDLQSPPNIQMPPVQFASMVFGSDPLIPGMKGMFTIERRVGAPWTAGLFFSKAYMRTDAHIAALENLDRQLGAA